MIKKWSIQQLLLEIWMRRFTTTVICLALKFAFKDLPKKRDGFLYLEEQPGIEIELIRDIDPIGEYNKSGIVNHLAFTVEDINKAIQHYKSKGIEFLSSEPQPTLEGGRMILFHGPNEELLQLVERVKL